LTSPINTIQVSNQRIFVTDIATSFHCFRLKAKEATFHEFCDDILPRWVTATTLLDHHTIVGLDKF
jgi:splicing factor 3B subunit 3